MDAVFENLDWQRVSPALSGALVAPTLPGVYAYGDVQQSLRLPSMFRWVYVGRSLNLRRRLAEHRPEYEQNPNLREWLSRAGSIGELWYAVTDTDTVALIELTLIHVLEPPFNRLNNK